MPTLHPGSCPLLLRSQPYLLFVLSTNYLRRLALQPHGLTHRPLRFLAVWQGPLGKS